MLHTRHRRARCDGFIGDHRAAPGLKPLIWNHWTPRHVHRLRTLTLTSIEPLLMRRGYHRRLTRHGEMRIELLHLCCICRRLWYSSLLDWDSLLRHRSVLLNGLAFILVCLSHSHVRSHVRSHVWRVSLWGLGGVLLVLLDLWWLCRLRYRRRLRWRMR